ncbi:ankyrin repeat domain-containing protein [Flavivirga rizhaonensis]|uniref:Ankyrin repeat domain-containing protein n=1 Tax=Flavivirga rizhaonensis TaxID=2559571 RepID=A0A4V6R486_9FLAO|nr:hypothetical protein [Flavivirga rizhaonensis]TGV03794.1 hypothetical protein EM932_05110 [Flavivirga rizhaonensis]
MKFTYQLLIVVIILAYAPSYAQKSPEFQIKKPWQKLFWGITIRDTSEVKQALKIGADINQSVNGLTPITFFSLGIGNKDELDVEKDFFGFLVKNGALLNIGYLDALTNTITLNEQAYDDKYKGHFYATLDKTINEENEIKWRHHLNYHKVALFKQSLQLNEDYQRLSPKEKMELMEDQEIYYSYTVETNFLFFHTKEIDDYIVNLNALDFIYGLKLEEYFELPEKKKQLQELIVKNDVQGLKKKYQQYKLPFSSKHNPKAQYTLFNFSPNQFEVSKEILEFAIQNGFDVNAAFEDQYENFKYGRLIESIYHYKGKNYLPSEPEFEFFKAIYGMCLDAGLDMNFTYENDWKIEGLILDIISRGNEELFDMIPKDQLKADYHFLRFALSSQNNPLLDRVLELPFTPEQLTEGIFKIIDDQFTSPNMATLEKLLKKGANLKIRKDGVDERSYKKYTVINAILENKKIENKLAYIKLMVKYGADINQPDIKTYGQKKPSSNPMYYALTNLRNTSQKLEILSYFLDMGAYPYSDDYDSEEDIFEVALQGSKQDLWIMIDFLIERDIVVTPKAIERLEDIIKPKNCKTCKKRPELKPYLNKLRERID